MESATFGATIPRTRNGRLVACEPCQRRKYACDRTFPICQRCRRSRAKKPCIYLTQSSAIYSNSSAVTFSTSPQGGTQDAQQILDEQAPPGSTHREPNCSLHEVSNCLNNAEKASVSKSSSLHRCSSFDISAENWQTALGVLASLPSLQAEITLAKPHINPFDGWIPFSTTAILTELKAIFPQAPCEKGSSNFLEALALTTFSNTGQGFSDSQCYPPADWYCTISGSKLSWEVVGLLFSSWALSALQNKEEIDGYRPRVLALKFLENMEKCISFCQERNAGNPLLLYLLYRTSIVWSILHGPNSDGFWRFFSDAVTLACSMGLNNMKSTSIQDPRISKQSERRLFTAIYILDKTAATFSGKYPLLASENCSTALPLDICNTILLHWKPTQIADLVSLGVNERGWNSRGEIYSTTSLRARGSIAEIREAILAFALHRKQRNVHDLITLKSKQRMIFNSFPEELRLHDNDTKIESIEPRVLYTKLFIRLEYLQNLFMIDRLLQKMQTNISPDGLIHTSLDIVSLTVTLWTRKDTLLGMLGDHEWIIRGYAVPAVVVLCESLLQSDLYHFSAPSISIIVQQLSLLLAFLEWLLVKVPCTDHCYRIKAFIVQVLDQILNPIPQKAEEFDVRLASKEVCLRNMKDIDTFSWLS